MHVITHPEVMLHRCKQPWNACSSHYEIMVGPALRDEESLSFERLESLAKTVKRVVQALGEDPAVVTADELDHTLKRLKCPPSAGCRKLGEAHLKIMTWRMAVRGSSFSFQGPAERHFVLPGRTRRAHEKSTRGGWLCQRL